MPKAPERRRCDDSDDEGEIEEITKIEKLTGHVKSETDADDKLLDERPSITNSAKVDVPPEKPRSGRGNFFKLGKANSNRGLLKKKTSKRNVFGRAKSWKGSVDLSDDDQSNVVN
jgi:hypothetical protein